MRVSNSGSSQFLLKLIGFIAVSSLKTIPISYYTSIKFSIVAINIDNSLMAVTLFFFNFIQLV